MKRPGDLRDIVHPPGDVDGMITAGWAKPHRTRSGAAVTDRRTHIKDGNCAASGAVDGFDMEATGRPVVAVRAIQCCSLSVAGEDVVFW
jgi:hypothetical protein